MEIIKWLIEFPDFMKKCDQFVILETVSVYLNFCYRFYQKLPKFEKHEYFEFPALNYWKIPVSTLELIFDGQNENLN